MTAHRFWGVTTLRILDALEHIGPMTRGEMCAHLRLTREKCAAIFTRLARPQLRPLGPKRVHISAWVYDGDDGERRYPRAVYAIGDGKDKPKPRSDTKANRKRYRVNKTGRSLSAVFEVNRGVSH
jgi:hypothetical protein